MRPPGSCSRSCDGRWWRRARATLGRGRGRRVLRRWRGRGHARRAPARPEVALRGRDRGTRAGSGRLRLRVVPDASARSLGGFVAASVERGAIVRTDAWPGYAGLRELGFDHRPRSQRALRAAGGDEDLVPRLHRAVSNRRAGCAAPTAASPATISRSTSTSSSSALTGAAARWRPFRPCSAWAPCTRRPPTSRSPGGIRQRLESTGYADVC